MEIATHGILVNYVDCKNYEMFCRESATKLVATCCLDKHFFRCCRNMMNKKLEVVRKTMTMINTCMCVCM